MLNTYSTAGHTAPEFDLRFHDNAEGCMGYHGLHVVTTDGRTTVNVCYTHERPVMQDGMRARTLLHESAHAWVNQNVSEAQIDEFMTVRGLTVWEGSEAEWSALGAEHAAEILMWGMTDGTYMITPRIDSSDSDNLRAAYGILIGA